MSRAQAHDGTLYADEMADITTVARYLCQAAKPYDRGGLVDARACVECDSPCAYGRRYLKLLSAEQIRELWCGEPCKECRRPCLLYGIATARKMRARAGKEWLEVALRPKEERGDA